MVVISTYYDPSQPYSLFMVLMGRIKDCPFDVSQQDLFGYVYGDQCGVVEDIAFNPSNNVIAYSGMID